MSEEKKEFWVDTKMFGPLPSSTLFVGFAIFNQNSGDNYPEAKIVTNCNDQKLALKMVLAIIQDVFSGDASMTEDLPQ